MKRFFIAALCAALLLSLFACEGAVTGVPGAGESSGAAEGSPETSKPEQEAPECEVKTLIDARYRGAVDRDLPRNNILRGRSYTVSGSVNADYAGQPDTLSDGVLPYSFNHYAWIGFNTGTTDVVFDLGEVTNMIGAVNAVCLWQKDYGILLPHTVTLMISEDGERYTRVCTETGISGGERAEVYNIEFNLQEYVAARYIKFRMIGAGLIFVGELEAYAYGVERDDSLDLVQIYPDYEVPHAELSLRENGDAGIANLARGAEVHAVAFSTVEKRHSGEDGNSRNTALLCDGVKSTIPAWDSASTFRVSRGDGREFIFDLGFTAAVKDFAAQGLYKPSWGVYPPNEIAVCVSADGENWQNVAVMKVSADQLDGNEKMIEFAASANGFYMARFVSFSFVFATHAALTEFEIFGCEKAPASARMPDPDGDDCGMPFAYPAADSLGGAQNVLCSYLCATNSYCGVDETMLTADDYLDIIGYYKDGELKDVIFDGMVVTPHSNFAPQAARETLAGWQPFFDTLFTPDRGLEAISQAAGRIGEATGNAGYKEKIFLSVIRPGYAVEGFGDIDGDGIGEPLDTLENRKKVIRWQVDMQLRRLAGIDAKNIDLIGFYWLSEAIYYDLPDEVELVKYAIDYVHGKGYMMFWIPYYNAAGWNTWKDLGFDFACLQPNYCFSSIDDPDRLYTTAVKAKLYGMAVEMELNYPTADEHVKRYKEYVAAGKKYGFYTSPKVYYLGGAPSYLTAARNSGYEYMRSIYEDTYLYSKCVVPEDFATVREPERKAPEAGPVEGNRDKMINGTVRLETEERFEFVVTVMPKYGTLQLAPNGSFRYTPEKGFYGVDYFCVAAKYSNGLSDETRVDVTVKYTE